MKKTFIVFSIFAGGALSLGGINAFFAHTNEVEFCTSCHTMQWNFEEYKQSVHYTNASGVRATCADCHVPKEFFPKVASKARALKDVYHQMVGTIDTKEKFDARRWEMASRVWARMEANDSRECRSCHDFGTMKLASQDRFASKKHARAQKKGQTCIECHQGIAHKQPDRPLDDIEL